MKCGVSLLVLALGLTGAAAAHAAGYKSVGANPVVAYDAPTERATKVYVAPRGMPVEVVLVENGWSKVRDAAGDLFWLKNDGLSAARTVIVTVPSAELHAAADDHSPLLATIAKGVLLDLVAPPSSGWVKVRHRDGLTGFVRSNEIWGD